MPVRSFSIYGWPGLTYIQDSALLTGVTILNVKRNGRGYDQTLSTPVNRQFIHEPGLGIIRFPDDAIFNGPTSGRPNRRELETVYVLYKSPI